MRYWWVNQNKTYRHEIAGGYLWSPKRKANQQRNPFYESMREVSPGDLVFSYFDTRIAALGIAQSYCYESPKPTEFGSAGANWGPDGAIGWKVEVAFRKLEHSIRPKDSIAELRRFLPAKYSPLRANGDGLQNLYLTWIEPPLARVLLSLAGAEGRAIVDQADAVSRAERADPAPEPTLEEWEQRVEANLREDPQLPDTQRQALIQARRGQGIFRANVQMIERACRITKVDRREHLIAGHIKPWRDGSNQERLDGENGLLLTPTFDHLFDKGFISFENIGDLIISPVADSASMHRMGIPLDRPTNVGVFPEGQRRYLEYHRDNVLRMSKQDRSRH